MRDLADFWSDFLEHCKQPPFVHPADQEYLKRSPYGRSRLKDNLDFRTFLSSRRFGDKNDGEFHFSLLPVPYVGNLSTASVFILLLNPGFNPIDYYGEFRRPEFLPALQQNLKQDLGTKDFPFLYLNPEFCWHSAYGWWEGKLSDVIRAVADGRHRGKYLRALKEVSQRIAAIELVPYHSTHYIGRNLGGRLPSAQVARNWVRTSLVPRARAGDVTVVVTRQIAMWGIKEIPGRIVCYGAHEARSAHLSKGSRGGKLILKRLLGAM